MECVHRNPVRAFAHNFDVVYKETELTVFAIGYICSLKLNGAKSERCLFLMNKLTVLVYLCGYIIYIWLAVAVGPPKFRVIYINGFSGNFCAVYRKTNFKSAVITASALKRKLNILKITPLAVKFIGNIALGKISRLYKELRKIYP